MFTVFEARIEQFAYIFLLNIHYNLSGMYYYYSQFIHVVKELVPNLIVSCLRYSSGSLFTEPRFCAMGETKFGAQLQKLNCELMDSIAPTMTIMEWQLHMKDA